MIDFKQRLNKIVEKMKKYDKNNNFLALDKISIPGNI